MSDTIPQGPVTNVAADKSLGMTLDELGRFVQDAYRRELPGDSWISVVPGFRRSQLHKITANPEPPERR